MDPYLDYQRFQAQQDQFGQRQDNADDMMDWRRGESQARQARFDQSSGFRDRTTDIAELRAMAAAQRSMLPADALAARQAIGQRVRDMGQPSQPQIGWAQLGAMREAQALPEPPAPGIGGRWQDMGGSRFGNEVQFRGGGGMSLDPSLSEADKTAEFDRITGQQQQMAIRAAQMRQMNQQPPMGPDPFDEAVRHLKGYEQVYGENPGALASDMVREPGGKIMSGYDAEHELAYSPGKWEFDNAQQKDVYREGRIIKLPKAQRAAMMRYLQQMGPDQAGGSPDMAKPNGAQMLGQIMSQAGAPHSRETLIQALEKAKAQGITNPQHLLQVMDETRNSALDAGRQNATSYLHARTATDQWNARQRPLPSNPVYGNPNMTIPQGY